MRKLRLAAEINKMPQKLEQSTRAAYKRWRIAIFSVGTILLHTIATVTVDATAIAMATTVATMLTTVAATSSSSPATPEYLRRSIRVGYNGSAVILCKTSDRINTWFQELGENKTINPLTVTNKDLDPYAVLLLNNIKENSIYRCMNRGEILSETVLTIAAPDLTTPEQIQIGSGDDAAPVFVHLGADKIDYWKGKLHSGYNDTRDENIKLVHIDKNTAIILISNASAQKSVFTFTYGNNAAKQCTLYVGKAPEPAKSFHCIGMNYEYMKCTINMQPNNLLTEYTITYELVNNPKTCQLDDFSIDIKHFTLLTNNSDTCTYLPGEKFYNFTLTASNVLGEFKNEFFINNHEHVVPAKMEVKLSEITDKNVHLTWDNNRKPYFIYGLVYNITVEPVGSEKFFIIKEKSCSKCSVTLDLPYAYWNYKFDIKARVNLARGEWNEPTKLNFQTAQRKPDRAPHTFVGGFHIYQETISLYWEGLAAYERNGPNFTYIIKALDVQGNELYISETQETTIVFHGLRRPNIYKVYAKNAVGLAPNVSIIQLPPIDLDPQLETEMLYEKSEYKLKWKHTRDFGNLLQPSNYTVFWCRSRMNECEDTMHFKVVNNTVNKYNLPSKNEQKMGVAANYPFGSSGLYWPACIANLNESLRNAADLEVNAESESRIFLRWSHKNCINAFDGYNITYCIWHNGTKSNCSSVNEKNPRSQNFTLKNLKTYTYYNITLQLYGKNNRTSPLIARNCRTNEAAPEPPTNVYCEANGITSHSAKISWDAPIVRNGLLRKYYVWYKNYNEQKANYIEVSSTEQSVVLNQLSSGSVYEIWLTAWTIKQSIKSASIHITTMIGKPKNPENVTFDRVGDEYLLTWYAAEYSVDHIQFFELIYNDSDIKHILTVQRVSRLGQKYECRLDYRDCTDGTQSMQVRAVNVVAERDLDKSAFAIDFENMQRRRRSADPAYNGSIVETQTTTKENISKNNGLQKKRFVEDNNKTAKNLAKKYQTYAGFQCNQIGEGIKTVLPPMSDTRYYMLKSEPVFANKQYNCPKLAWPTFTVLSIFVSMFIGTVLWIYKIFRAQADIEIRLPAAVIKGMIPNTNSTSCLKDNESKNISIVSSNAGDSTALINISNTLLSSSSSESGVDGVGASDTDTPSTSSEDVDREIENCGEKSEPTTSQTTITLNSFGCSQSPLWANPEQEHIKPTNKTNNTSSNFTYETINSILNKSAKIPDFRQTTNNNNTVINNNNMIECLPDTNNYVLTDSLHKLTHAARNSSTNPLNSGAAQSNFLRTFADISYVNPNSLSRMPTAHTASMRADNNQSEKRLPQTKTDACDYVPLDSLPTNAAPQSFTLENEISRNPSQPFLPTNSTHVQPKIIKNTTFAKGDYVSPDSLKEMTAKHNAARAVDNDNSQKPAHSFALEISQSPPVNSLERKSSQVNPTAVHSNLGTFDDIAYVTPNSLSMYLQMHSSRADNNQSENRLPQIKTDDCDYVPADSLPMNAAPHSFTLENEISRNSSAQPFLPTNSAHVQPKIMKNTTFAKGDYVSPDSLKAMTAKHNAARAVDNDNSQKALTQQVHYGYVPPEFWSQQIN